MSNVQISEASLRLYYPELGKTDKDGNNKLSDHNLRFNFQMEQAIQTGSLDLPTVTDNTGATKVKVTKTFFIKAAKYFNSLLWEITRAINLAGRVDPDGQFAIGILDWWRGRAGLPAFNRYEEFTSYNLAVGKNELKAIYKYISDLAVESTAKMFAYRDMNKLTTEERKQRKASEFAEYVIKGDNLRSLVMWGMNIPSKVNKKTVGIMQPYNGPMLQGIDSNAYYKLRKGILSYLVSNAFFNTGSGRTYPGQSSSSRPPRYVDIESFAKAVVGNTIISKSTGGSYVMRQIRDQAGTPKYAPLTAREALNARYSAYQSTITPRQGEKPLPEISVRSIIIGTVAVAVSKADKLANDYSNRALSSILNSARPLPGDKVNTFENQITERAKIFKSK